jgi:hypothetical protein
MKIQINAIEAEDDCVYRVHIQECGQERVVRTFLFDITTDVELVSWRSEFDECYPGDKSCFLPLMRAVHAFHAARVIDIDKE